MRCWPRRTQENQRMARIEVTEESLREQVQPGVFGQALALTGRVSELSSGGPLVEATVDGVAVSVRVLQDGIDARCRCQTSGPCPHAVAALLAWVRAGEDKQIPGLFEVLRAQDRDWLAARLAGLAAGDPALAARLLDETGDGEAAGAVADLRAEFEEVLGELADEARNQDCYGEWYPDTGDLEELLDEAEALVGEAPEAVRELADHAIGLIERVLDFENCYGEDLTDALAHAEELYLAACRAGSPDPGRLAERLIRGALESGWGSFGTALPEYADVLGAAGMSRCRELLAQATGPDHALRTLRESLARAEGGTDAVVDMLSHDARTPYDFERIARILITDGRDDDALAWITRGLEVFPADTRLPSLALECHRRAGRRDQALEMLWRLFTLRPGTWSYQELKQEAGDDARLWADRAIAHLRTSGPPLPTALAGILFLEGDVAAAWDLVCRDGNAIPFDLRMQVVAERAETHPGDAIPVYQDLAAIHVGRGSRPGYQEAIKYMRMASDLSRRSGTQEEFRAFMADLRAAHPGKKVLQQELDKAGLP